MKLAGIVVVLAACAGPSAQSADRPVPAKDNETALNSRRWMYASYVNAMKRKVAGLWDPAGVWSTLPSPQRAAARADKLETVVHVALTSDGRIATLDVRTPSGVAVLDGEAVRAFHAAAPFGDAPNGKPPLPFDFRFVFETGSGVASTSVGP